MTCSVISSEWPVRERLNISSAHQPFGEKPSLGSFLHARQNLIEVQAFCLPDEPRFQTILRISTLLCPRDAITLNPSLSNIETVPRYFE